MIFSAIAGAVATFSTWFAGIGAVAQFAIRVGVSVGFSLLSRALAGKPSTGQRGFSFELAQGADLPRSFILGRYGTAGSLVYHNHWGGSDNEYYTCVIALSDLPVAGLAALWIDGEKVTPDWDNPDGDKGAPIAELSVTSTKTVRGPEDQRGVSSWEEVEERKVYGWVKFHDGTQTEADPLLVNEVATEERPWGAEDVGHGVAYAVLTFRMNAKLFNRRPEAIFEVDGVPLLDAQTGEIGTGDDITAVQAHALLSGFRYGDAWFYGPQSAARLDATEWGLQIAACKAPVPGAAEMGEAERIAAFGSTTVPARYRSGLEVSVDRPVAEVLEDVISAANARISEVGTRYRFQIGDPEPAVASFTDGDIVSTAGQSFAPFFPLAETVNAITATYPEPGEGWQAQDAPPLYNPDYEAEDGDRRLPNAVELSAVPYREQVQRLMASALAEARRARRHTLVLPSAFWALEPGDYVTWSSERNGYQGKLMRVDGLRDLQNGDVQVDLTEVDPEDYAWSAAQDYRLVTPGSVMGQPVPALAIAGWSVRPVSLVDGDDEERRPAIQVTWTDPDRDDVQGIEWQLQLATGAGVAAGLVTDIAAGKATIVEALSARVGETEAGIVSESSRRQLLTASVTELETGLEAGIEASIGTLWDSWVANDDLRRGVALQMTDQRSYVEEGLVAEASARQMLGAALEEAQASLRQEAITRATADTAQAQQISALQAGLSDAESGIAAASEATNTLATRVRTAEEGITAQAEEVTSLRSDLEDAEDDIAANALAATSLTTRVSEAEGEIESQSQAITTLQSSLDGAEGDIAANAFATTNLTTRVADAEDKIGSQAQAITTLQSSLEDAEGDIAANALATTNLTTRVAEAEGEIGSQSQAITTLQSGIKDADGAIAANALATTNLTTRVSDAEGAIESQSQAITTLQSSLDGAEGDIEANAVATSNLTTRVSDAEDAIGSQSQAITTLQSSLEDAEGDIAANALATTNLTTRVFQAEGVIGSQSQALTTLRSSLEGAEDGVAANVQAITGLTTRVEDNEDGLSAQAGKIDSLEVSLQAPGTGISARLETIEATRVDAAGAVAAADSVISASYGSLTALAEATAFAEARADGISSGFVLRLNGEGVFEAVSVAEGTDGAVTTALIGADYVKITGLTQIEQAVINQLAVDTGFIDNLTVGNAQITGTLASDNYAQDATGRPTAGWMLDKDTGAMKLAGPLISRQLAIAEGSFTPGVLSVSASDGLKLRQSWDLIPTGVALPLNQVWMPSTRTYLAYAAFNGTAEADGGITGNDEYWGCIATLQPFARWNGPQQLYLRIELWSQGVTKLYSYADPAVSGTIHWKLYEVS